MNEELNVAAALRWLFEVCESQSDLTARIERARAFYLAATDFSAGRWSSKQPFDGFDDRMAVLLVQAIATLHDRRTYDVELASETLPFLVLIGAYVEVLRNIPGASERAKRMLSPTERHPDSGIFELVTALRYAREPGLRVKFNVEGSERSADFRISLDEGEHPQDIHVECKRLRPSVYEATENRRALTILNQVNDFVHTQKLSLVVDVTFTAELANIPDDYLLHHLESVVESRAIGPKPYTWRDEFGEGIVRTSDLASVHHDTRDSSLLVGSKLARLLAGGDRPEEQFHLMCGGIPRTEDTRFIDEIDYGSAIFWRCLAQPSIESRARHIRSKLADIDRQVANAPFSIAHIGMDVERDARTADLRRQRNMDTAKQFRPDSNLIEVDLHYFMPRVSEVKSWMIDETVEPYSRMVGPFLSGTSRLLGGTADGLVEHEPAWRQRIPR